MDFKELIKFGLEESSEPIIKNPVLRNAMAEGGRIGFKYAGPVNFENIIKPKKFEQGNRWKKLPKGTYTMRLYMGLDENGKRIEQTFTGTKTQLKKIFDKKNKGRVKGDLPTMGDSKVYQVRQGTNKGKWAIKMPKEDKYSFYKTETLAEKHKTDYLNNPANKVGGKRLKKVTPPDGYVSGKKMLEAAKKKNIYVGENRQASNFADVFDFPKTTKDGQMFYDISKLNNEKAVDTILEAQVRSGSATNYARKKFPIKTVYDHTKKRNIAIKKAGGWGKNDPWAARKGSGVQLGHADDFWFGRKITPQNLLYTPSEINKLIGDPGMIDDKINAVYEKQEYGKLTKEGDELKKFLNETDATLTRLADQTDGFKQVTLSNNKPYGGGKFSVDMFDDFKGMSQKETIDFVNKWKDKKIITEEMVKKNPSLKVTPLNEVENIKKANFFEMNRKSAYKAAGKMSGKEKSKVMYKVKEDFRKQLLRLGGCGLYAGGRVGFKNGSKCINRAMAKLKSGKLNASEKKIVDAMGDGLKKIGGKGGLPKKFWTTALKGEGYFALADFANNLTKGQSLDKSFTNAIKTATFGLADFKGNERDLLKYAEERGLDTEAIKQWMDYGKTYGKYEKAYEDMDSATEILASDEIVGPDDSMLQTSVIEQTPSRIKKLDEQLTEKEKQESIYSGKGSKDFNEAIEGVIAKEWNKTAGTPFDRGYRKMVGMKGDEGLVWGGLGALTREGLEQAGLGEHDALKGFTPQKIMNYHPVYGYKEDIKDVIREGDSPMEDMLMFMEKYYPSSALLEEAARDKMGTYDYDPNLGYNYAGGGIAGIRRPSAIPPESGPTPYGLPSMLNRVKRV